MSNNYGALIVLYNPTDQELKNAIHLSHMFHKMYIYDNSVVNTRFFENEKNIHYFYNGINEGLSIAYNFILKISIQDGIDWLMILDQDSRVEEETINKMRVYSNRLCNDKLAIISPNIQYNDIAPTNQTTKYVKWAINSGQMINVSCVLNHQIMYDENLFLDRVDRDFCEQLRIHNLKILQVGDAVLIHSLGEQYNGVITHSPLRNYYMFKNRLYFNDKYFNVVKASMLNVLQSVKHIIIILRSKRQIKENLQMIKRAYKDYLKGRMGKLEDCEIENRS